MLAEKGNKKAKLVQKLQEDENKRRKELYDKIYDFLYNDGIIVAYETL